MTHIQKIDRFTHAQTHQQNSEECWVLANLGSLNHMSVALPSGETLFNGTGNQQFALLVPQGSPCDFEYGEGRDDWVIKLNDGTITESENGAVHLKWEGMDDVFPACHPLDAVQVERCRGHLTRMLQAYHDPAKVTRTMMNLALSSLLDCILNPELSIEREDPAEALRKRIIEDRGFIKTLSALSLECGYSPDHLRRLFETRFGVSPKAYRTTYRMGIARNLLELGMPVVTVSEQLGYGYPAHFSTSFKKHFGQTPGAAR